MSRRQTLPNFTEWNYDTGIATEYERVGECNQCGECCTLRFNLTMIDGDKRLHGGRTTDEKGVWSEIEESKEFIRFTPTEEPEVCMALDLNKCMEDEFKRKPWVCRIFPTIPNDIKFLPNCSYKFIKGKEYVIDELEYVKTE